MTTVTTASTQPSWNHANSSYNTKHRSLSLPSTPYLLSPSSTYNSGSSKRPFLSPTLRSSRPSPYPSPLSPMFNNAEAGSSTNLGRPTRPKAPMRSHSFCGNSPSSTYALASTGGQGSHLSPDKSMLVAPPLTRTLSSMGPKQGVMQRYMGMESPSRLNIGTTSPHSMSSPRSASTSPKSSPRPTITIPEIHIHPSLTPPRPSLAQMRTESDISDAQPITPSTPSITSANLSSFPISSSSTMPVSIPACMEMKKEKGFDAMDVEQVEDVIDGVEVLAVSA